MEIWLSLSFCACAIENWPKWLQLYCTVKLESVCSVGLIVIYDISRVCVYKIGWKLVTHRSIHDKFWCHTRFSVLSPVLFSVYIDDIGQLQNNLTCTFVVLCADDILLLAPSIATLQQLLRACEQELDSIDMSINVNKMLSYRRETALQGAL